MSILLHEKPKRKISKLLAPACQRTPWHVIAPTKHIIEISLHRAEHSPPLSHWHMLQ